MKTNLSPPRKFYVRVQTGSKVLLLFFMTFLALLSQRAFADEGFYQCYIGTFKLVYPKAGGVYHGGSPVPIKWDKQSEVSANTPNNWYLYNNYHVNVVFNGFEGTTPVTNHVVVDEDINTICWKFAPTSCNWSGKLTITVSYLRDHALGDAPVVIADFRTVNIIPVILPTPQQASYVLLCQPGEYEISPLPQAPNCPDCVPQWYASPSSPNGSTRENEGYTWKKFWGDPVFGGVFIYYVSYKSPGCSQETTTPRMEVVVSILPKFPEADEQHEQGFVENEPTNVTCFTTNFWPLSFDALSYQDQANSTLNDFPTDPAPNYSYKVNVKTWVTWSPVDYSQLTADEYRVCVDNIDEIAVNQKKIWTGYLNNDVMVAVTNPNDALDTIAKFHPSQCQSAAVKYVDVTKTPFSPPRPSSSNNLVSKESDIYLFPNPATGKVTVYYSFQQEDSGVLLVTNSIGQIVMTQELKLTNTHDGNTNGALFSTEGLSQGIYTASVVFNNDNRIFNTKLSVIK